MVSYRSAHTHSNRAKVMCHSNKSTLSYLALKCECERVIVAWLTECVPSTSSPRVSATMMATYVGTCAQIFLHSQFIHTESVNSPGDCVIANVRSQRPKSTSAKTAMTNSGMLQTIQLFTLSCWPYGVLLLLLLLLFVGQCADHTIYLATSSSVGILLWPHRACELLWTGGVWFTVQLVEARWL